MRFKILFLIILCLLSFNFVANAEKINSYTVLTNATSGIIDNNSSLIVRFSKQVKGYLTDKNINADFFKITPQINGKSFFNDDYLFEFKPYNGFESNKIYKYSIDLSKLYKNFDFTENILNFEFRTPERVLRKINSIITSKTNDPVNSLRIKIDLELSTQTSLELINKTCLFQMNKKPILFYTETKDNMNFTLISQPVLRENKDYYINFIMDKTQLNMLDNSNIKITIPRLKEMKVEQVEAIMSGNTLYGQIVFSEPLKKDFNFNGFIYADGIDDIKFRLDGNIVYLYGNFKNGKKYNIRVNEGIRSEYGNSSQSKFNKEVVFPDMQPEVNFTQEGSLLSGLNSDKIVISSVNTEKVQMTIRKVYSNNVAFFLQDNDLSGGSDYYYNSHRTGEEIYKQNIYIGKEKNSIIRTEIDISSLFLEHKDGFFIISVGFDDYREKVSLKEGNYYSNSNRPIVRTDIGLVAKKSNEEIIVYAMDVKNSLPIMGVKFKLYSYYNQLIDIGFSNEFGRYKFKNYKDSFFITAEWNNMQSYIKFNSSIIDTTTFNTGGVLANKNINAFIYTEKGVYRPGETINVSMILRDNDNKTINEKLPVKAELYNSANKRTGESISKQGKNGFYTFEFKTNANDLTGVWKTVINAGPETFEQKILVEDILPQNIRVEVNKDKENLQKGDNNIKIDVFSEYLYKSPAKELECEISWKFIPYDLKFDKYSSFDFSGKNTSIILNNSDILKKTLDNSGKTSVNIPIPIIENVASGIKLEVKVRVIEKSGRSVENTVYIPYFVYEKYTGIRNIADNYVKTGQNQIFDIIRIDKNQNLVKKENLKYRIYKNQRWWWWDYSSKGDYRKHYKNSLTTELLYEGNIDFKGNIAKIEYTPEQWGEYLIEIIPEDNNENHIATMFFGAYSWGSQAKVDEGVLESNYDNKTYKPGDIVSIPLNTPGKGRAWVSVENGNKILWEKWIDINKKDMEFDIRVTPDMIPNSYVFITLVQPQEQKNNDLPLRLYTIREIKVNSSERNIDYSINTDSVFKPGKDIRVNLKSDKKEKSLFTVSVVDEGSLGLTNYKTPSPYDYFYQKRALGVDTMDILKDVIQKDKGVIHKYFKTGGSDLGSEITKRSSPVMSKRVEPVTLFSGIKETDSNGEAIIDFKMPQYNGAVRIMVAGAYNNAFGRAEKTVPVKDKFIINPSMPMFLSPGDEFTALVQIISTEKNTKCDIYAVCDDKILNNNKKTQISLIKNKEYSHYFNFKANDIIGNSKIDIIIEDNKEKFVESINIPIRPDNSYSSDFKTNIIKKGKSQNIVFEQIGYENTVSKYLKLSSQLIPDFTNRFNNTVNYSYYSLNNIVSSAYALIETDISYTNLSEKDKTDKINKSIKEILKYQLFNGGFSRYQNNNEYDLFLTSFAGEFLNKAYNKGYYIPQKELELWKNFQKRQCINPEGDIRDRVFRVFVMAKSDVFEFGEMNILYQNSLNKIDNGLKVLLAYSYLKAGNLNTSNKILNSVYYKDIISNNSYFDKYAALAVLLEISLINNDEKISHELYKDIVKIFNSNKWLTDIEIIYCINSLNNYMQKYSVNDSFSADLFIENEKTSINNKKEFKTSIKSKINTVKIQNTGNSDLYWFSSWHGIPKTRSFESKSNGNMELSRGFYNNNGDIFDIKNTNQGDVFKIVIEVKNNNDKNLDNIVLNQIIPAGWEIINPSYNGGVLSGNYDNYTIRDDRVIWFFNLNSNERRSFEFNITSVIPGKFILPQAYCEVINKHGINAYSSSFYINVLKRQ